MQTQTCDRLATTSLIIGVIGAALTGFFHYRFMILTYLNFNGYDLEYLLLLGSSVLLLLLAGADLSAGFAAIGQIRKSAHRTLSETLAFSGITLGFVEILPASLILSIIMELFLMRFIALRPFLEF